MIKKFKEFEPINEAKKASKTEVKYPTKKDWDNFNKQIDKNTKEWIKEDKKDKSPKKKLEDAKFKKWLKEEMKKEDEAADKENDKFNDQLNFITTLFKKDPLSVVKAFGCSEDDLAEGKFRLNKQLDFSEPDQIEKVYKKLQKNKK